MTGLEPDKEAGIRELRRDSCPSQPEILPRNLRNRWHDIESTLNLSLRTTHSQIHGGGDAGGVRSTGRATPESAAARSFHSVREQRHCYPFFVHGGYASNELWEEASKNQPGQMSDSRTLGIVLIQKNRLVLCLYHQQYRNSQRFRSRSCSQFMNLVNKNTDGTRSGDRTNKITVVLIFHFF